jgi:predicted flap endonuclease-1-like 5' DNA nuclease
MAVAEPIQTPAPVVEAPVAEPAKTEDPIPEAPQVQVEPPIEEPKVEAPTTIEPPPAPEAPQPAPAQVTAPPAPEPAPQVSSVIPPELVKIRGINPKRAEQLKAIGVGTIADLAKASPDELAAKLGVSPKIIKMWIGSAKKLVK